MFPPLVLINFVLTISLHQNGKKKKSQALQFDRNTVAKTSLWPQ